MTVARKIAAVTEKHVVIGEVDFTDAVYKGTKPTGTFLLLKDAVPNKRLGGTKQASAGVRGGYDHVVTCIMEHAWNKGEDGKLIPTPTRVQVKLNEGYTIRLKKPEVVETAPAAAGDEAPAEEPVENKKGKK